METLFPCIPAHPPEPATNTRTLTLQSFSYEARRAIMPALADAMTHCGCWLSERNVKSVSQVEFVFELQHRLVLDLYSALIGVGLELTRTSHLDLTSLCTLLRHSPIASERSRVIQIRLEISFLEDLDLKSVLMPGAARA